MDALQDERAESSGPSTPRAKRSASPRQLVLIPADPLKLQGERQHPHLDPSELRFHRTGDRPLPPVRNRHKDPAEVVKVRAKLRPILDKPAQDRTADETQTACRAVSRRGARARVRRANGSASSRRSWTVSASSTALVIGEQPGTERPFDYVRIRGAFASKGDKVYRRCAGRARRCLREAPRTAWASRGGSSSKDNPLTARVAVNRIWEHYFGRGMVETSEDFGTQGERPTHPELLDWLAVEFMDRGWSLKAMHRLIVTSTAYRQTSAISPEVLRADPYNRLISRGPRFRLEAESDPRRQPGGERPAQPQDRRTERVSAAAARRVGYALQRREMGGEQGRGQISARHLHVRPPFRSVSGDDELRRDQPRVLHRPPHSHQHAARRR